ncbi:MAG: PilZ domain-containing protein [Acidimicrobiia bacterium]
MWSRTEPVRARAWTALAVVAGFAALTWQVRRASAGVPLWLCVPFVVAELWAFAFFGLLAFACQPARRTPRGAGATGPVTIVVDSAGRTLEELHATLVACRALHGEHDTVVIDDRQRDDMNVFAMRNRARYELVDADLDHPGRLDLALGRVTTPFFAVVSAGHVPLPDFLDRCLATFDGESDAVAQAPIVRGETDARVGLSRGGVRRPLATATVPSLGARGVALWSGSAAVIRTDAMRRAGGFRADPIRTTLALFRAGYRIGAIDTPVHAVSRDLALTTAKRATRARSALSVLSSRDNPLWARGLAPAQRLAALGAIMRFTAGPHVALGLAVLVATLLSGRLPMNAALGPALAAWALAWLLQAAALRVLGRGAFHGLDRLRAGFRTVGSDCRAAASAFLRVPLDRGTRRVEAVRGWSDTVSVLRGLTGMLVTLDVVLLARFTSDVFGLGLPRFPGYQRYPALVVAAIAVAVAVDTVQLAAHRQVRARRVKLDVDIFFQSHLPPARVTDLSTTGVGILFRTENLTEQPLAGDPIGFELGLPTLAGDRERVAFLGTVRSVSPAGDDLVRLGVEFDAFSPTELDHVVEFCHVTHPWRTRLGVAPLDDDGPPVTIPDDRSGEQRRRRPVLKLANGLAAGVIAISMAPLAAFAAGTGTLQLHVRNGLGNPVGAQCVYAPADGTSSQATTDGSGNATVALDPGSYKIRVVDCSGDDTYATQYVHGSPDLAGAQTFTVTEGATTTVTVTMNLAGGGSGTCPS